ncbi:hypothetical protein [Psychrosphaera haliotis]|uniref:Uncharacterized protein n=1 Tax=Psychrosphaera haliotis TaxID=555083 RepID=A0A6N8FG44_9GAMM|nr:hypothetical protein [Psychrosphaera haliotis]MUH73231.1 hypothetical protein [Psychrosphaera haliotis]
MRKFKIALPLFAAAVVISGCSATNDNDTTAQVAKEPISAKHTLRARNANWCQEHYSSASVSKRDRQNNSKYCDTKSRQAYKNAKAKNEIEAKG